MNANEILNEITETLKKDRLIAIVSGGQSKMYFGKDYQISDIEKLSDEEINKLYMRYEAYLGNHMVNTIGNSFINLYVMGVSKYFKIKNPELLKKDLEKEPVLSTSLSQLCCLLYYNYGAYLAPVTTLLTTVSHIDFSNKENGTQEEPKDTTRE